MKLIEIKEKEKLNKFVIEYNSEFLQSFNWGELIREEGREIIRLGVEDGGNLQAVASLEKINSPLGYYLYCSRGPLGSQEGVNLLLKEIKKRYRRALLLRVEMKDIQLGNKSINIQPQKTLVLDLQQNESELLLKMHQKTRYNIRLAQRKDLEFVEGNYNNFSEFWKLMGMTGERDNFRLHSKEHYYNLLKKGQENIKIFFIKHKDKSIATGTFSFFGKKAVYLHGASDYEYRNLMAPYLLQWLVIKLAKKEGFKYYDFYGIDDKKWPGVTRFKLGFGGEVVEYVGTRDIVYNYPLYYFYKLIRAIKRLW